MRTLFAVVAIGMLTLGTVGCKNKHHDKNMDGSTQKMSADVCSHCPGVQTMTADGKCSGCGMKVNK